MIWIDGCFDGLHYGHFNGILQVYKQKQGMKLGIHSDEEIAKYKGPSLFREEDRYEMVKHCRFVNEVITGVPYVTTIETVTRYGCSQYAHGNDVPVSRDGIDCISEVRSVNGMYNEFQRTEGISTTHMKNQIVEYLVNGTVLMDPVTDYERQLKTEFDSVIDWSPPADDDIIVYIENDWSIFNITHLQQLLEAKSKGTYLIVGIKDGLFQNRYQIYLNLCAYRFIDKIVWATEEYPLTQTACIGSCDYVVKKIRNSILDYNQYLLTKDESITNKNSRLV